MIFPEWFGFQSRRPYRRRRHGHNDAQSVLSRLPALPFRAIHFERFVVAHHFFQLGVGEFIRMLRRSTATVATDAGV